MSGVKDNPLLIEFGVLEGVVEEGNGPVTVSVSILTVAFPVKSMPLFKGAVVSVG